MLRHLKHVFLVVHVILVIDHEVLQTIRGPFESRIRKRAGHVEILQLADVAIQIYVSTCVLVRVIDILITCD